MLRFLLLLIFSANSLGFVIKNLNKPIRFSMTTNLRKKENNIDIYFPKNSKQEEYNKYLSDDKVKLIFSIGPAGTGKTLFACQKAITELKNNNINKIILTRPIITLEEDIGFLPGVLNKKMEPWVKPFFDIFEEYCSPNELNNYIYNNKIEISPLLFMRGRTFKNCIVIADEMQNSSPNQMKMLLTRIGTGCKMLITGDLAQSDIIKENGLSDFIKKYNLHNENGEKVSGIKIINFSGEQVERSKIVQNILNIYDN